MAAEGRTTLARAARAWLLAIDAKASRARVFGLSPAERLQRALVRAGVDQIDILEPGQLPPQTCDQACVVFRADYFYDERLVVALVEGPERVLLGAAGLVAARIEAAHTADGIALLRQPTPAQDAALLGAPVVRPLEVADAYNAALRKHDPPFLHLARRENVRETEKRIFAASYKGITDLVTKWVWPLPARIVTGWCAERGIVPNAVTFVSYLLVALATLFFSLGWFAAGLLAGWIMTFLDTVDGKLARVTLTSSKLGGALDHGLDLVHPPIWWAAWAFGLAVDQASLGPHALWMWIIVAGYLVGRLLEGVFLMSFGQEIFTWRPFDAFFRTIIARRNPNLILLTIGVLCTRPDLGFAALGVWTLISIAVVVTRIGQAFAQSRSGSPIRPWHEEREPTSAAETLAETAA